MVAGFFFHDFIYQFSGASCLIMKERSEASFEDPKGNDSPASEYR